MAHKKTFRQGFLFFFLIVSSFGLASAAALKDDIELHDSRMERVERLGARNNERYEINFGAPTRSTRGPLERYYLEKRNFYDEKFKGIDELYQSYKQLIKKLEWEAADVLKGKEYRGSRGDKLELESYIERTLSKDAFRNFRCGSTRSPEVDEIRVRLPYEHESEIKVTSLFKCLTKEYDRLDGLLSIYQNARDKAQKLATAYHKSSVENLSDGGPIHCPRSQQTLQHTVNDMAQFQRTMGRLSGGVRVERAR